MVHHFILVLEGPAGATQQSFIGTRLQAENALGEFWNSSPAVIAEPGRWAAELYDGASLELLQTIG